MRILLVASALLLGTGSSLADSARGSFLVKVSLNRAAAAGGGCTSTTASAVGGSTLQVSCAPGIAVNVTQAALPAIGRFMPGFRPSRDSLLPDYCRSEISRGDQAARVTCRLDDQRPLSASADTDDGWAVESRLFAVTPDGDAQQTLARLRLKDDEGVLTGIRMASADGHAGPVEMLVSF